MKDIELTFHIFYTLMDEFKRTKSIIFFILELSGQVANISIFVHCSGRHEQQIKYSETRSLSLCFSSGCILSIAEDMTDLYSLWVSCQIQSNYFVWLLFKQALSTVVDIMHSKAFALWHKEVKSQVVLGKSTDEFCNTILPCLILVSYLWIPSIISFFQFFLFIVWHF